MTGNRRDLPSGTVTFLFTDVEGSTRLLYESGAEQYAAALKAHRRVIRDACGRQGGVEVDTQGDAFFFAFPTAPGALVAGEEVVEVLGSGPLRVRIGVHTGTPFLTDEGYVGSDVNRAARIAAAGSGGQILVSGSTAVLVDADLRDLGMHRFKDLAAAERVFQLGGEEFPALKSLGHTNLPIPATAFLGRERELSEVIELIGGDCRLLTLTGPGGIGKTRLALQASAEASDRYSAGVWWVSLASLRDPALVLTTVEHVLGAKVELARHIGDKPMLLVFDNFEQVVDASSEIVALLAACPALEMMVTSRERLRVRGEQTYPVPLLGPDDGEALFVARARSINPSFTSGDSVVELCSRLDELPLALELAAARTAVFSPEQMLDRLGTRLDLLKGERDADPRQQTLRATIQWSYDLLSPNEQALLDRLSVFADGCSYEASEQVAGADPDTLQSLLDKSLVRRRDAGSESRYWMLETIREFAAEQLAETGERDTTCERHLAFYVSLVVEAEPQLTGRSQKEWFDRLSVEQENVRAALGFACDRADGERALMLAGSFWRYWWTRGQIDEGERWYEAALAVGDGASDTARARGLFGLAHMSEARGDARRAGEQYEAAAELLRAVGETRWLVLALTHLAGAYRHDDPARFHALQDEAIAIAAASGDIRGAAIAKCNLADQLMVEGRTEDAATLLEEALDGLRAIEDIHGTASALAGLATVELDRGDLDQAAGRIGESINLSHSFGDTLTLSTWTLPLAAAVVARAGDPPTAAQLCGAASAAVDAYGLEVDAEAEETTSRIAAQLGSEFDDAWARGARLELGSAVDLAVVSLTTIFGSQSGGST